MEITLPYRYYTSYCVLIKDTRGNSFCSETEAFFFKVQVLHNHLWCVRLPQLNQWRQRSCTVYGWKARQSPPEWVGHLAISGLLKVRTPVRIRTGREFNPDPLDILSALVSLRPPCGARGTHTHTHTHTHTRTHTHTHTHTHIGAWTSVAVITDSFVRQST